MPNIDKSVQVSDTTKANSSNADCCKRLKQIMKNFTARHLLHLQLYGPEEIDTLSGD